MLLIRIFDLRIESQGHAKQRGILRRYVTNCMDYNLPRKLRIYLKPFVWLTIKSFMYTVYMLCHVKDRAFSLDLEYLHQGHRFGMQR